MSPPHRPCLVKHEFLHVSSTQSLALSWLRSSPHAPFPWLLFQALEQHAGQGQHGKTWSSPPGHFYGTYAIPWPCHKEHELLLITIAGALAVIDVLEGMGLFPQLKWVNDVILGGRKIAGVLGEIFRTRGQTLALVGIGVNITSRAHAAPLPKTAVSLHEACPRTPIDVHAFETYLSSALYRCIHALWDHSGSHLIQRADRLLLWKNRHVHLSHGNTTTHGTLVGLQNDGALLLQTQSTPTVSAFYQGSLSSPSP